MTAETLTLGLLSIAGAAVVVRGLVRPEWAVAILAAIAFTNAAASSGSENLLPAVLAIAFGGCALLLRRQQDDARAVIPFAALGGLFVAYAFISMLWSSSPDRAEAAAVDLGFQLLLAVGVVACVTSPRSVRWAVWAVIVAGTVMGLAALWQFRTGNYGWTAFGLARADYQQISGLAHAFRAGGPVGDANFFGQLMVVVVALALERMRSSVGLLARVVAAVSSIVAIGTILLTYSRGALIATVVVGVIAVLRMRHRTIAIAAGLVGLGLLVAVAPADYAQRLEQVPATVTGGVTGSGSDPAITGRASSWIVARDMTESSPVLGIGYGQYPVEYLSYSAHVGLDWRGEPRAAHSLPLQLLAELGLVGLLLMAAVVTGAFVSIRRARHELSRDPEAAELRSLLGGVNDALVGYLIAGVFLHSAHPAVLWVLLALAWSATQVTRRSRSATIQPLFPARPVARAH